MFSAQKIQAILARGLSLGKHGNGLYAIKGVKRTLNWNFLERLRCSSGVLSRP